MYSILGCSTELDKAAMIISIFGKEEMVAEVGITDADVMLSDVEAGILGQE